MADRRAAQMGIQALRTLRGHERALGAGLLGFILLLGWSPAAATIVDGRISAVSYLFEPVSSPVNPDPSTDMLLISRLSLNVREIGTPAWSFYYYGSALGEVLNEGFSSMRLKVYQGYLGYQPNRGLQARLGRLWVNGGVGSSLIDGASLRLNRSFGQVAAFAGTRGYFYPGGDTFPSLGKDAWDENGLVSLFYRSPGLWNQLHLGASWARTMWQGREEAERLGVLIDWRPHVRHRLFFENRYEFNQKVTYYRHLRWDFLLPTGRSSLSWNRWEGYQPAYETSYIFQRFQSESWFPDAMGRPADEVRARIELQPESWRGWHGSLALIGLWPQDLESGQGLDFWVGKGILRLGYRGLRGYGGLVDGFYGNLSYQASRSTRLWFELNRISYRYEYVGMPEVDLPRQFTVASRLGADYSLTSGWWFSGALEALQNPAADYEMRFLARIIYRFHLESGAKEVQ